MKKGVLTIVLLTVLMSCLAFAADKVATPVASFPGGMYDSSPFFYGMLMVSCDTPGATIDTVNQFSENRAIILLNSKKGYHPPFKEAIPNDQMSSLWFFQLLQKRTFSRWFSTISLQILSQDLPPFFFQKA